MPKMVGRGKYVGKGNKGSRKTIAKVVKNTLNRAIETKSRNDEAEEQSISSATQFTIYQLSQLTVGNTSSTFIGAKVQPVGVRLSYIIHNNSAVAQYFRVMIISCTQGDITAATDSILWRDSASVAVGERLRDVNTRLNTKRFSVVMDKVHRIAGLGDGTGIETVMRKTYKKLGSVKRTFIDPATDSESMKGNLRLLVFNRSADNDTTAAVCEFTYESDYYFKDA